MMSLEGKRVRLDASEDAFLFVSDVLGCGWVFCTVYEKILCDLLEGKQGIRVPQLAERLAFPMG